MGRMNESWHQTGTNSAGDAVYEKTAGGSQGSGAAATSSSQMSKAELQALAASRGLATSGTKNDLLDRLSGVGN